MISRVADHCFWLGRYAERAESTARLLAVTRNLALDADLAPRQAWLPVLIVAGEEPRYVARYGAAAVEDGEQVQRWLTWEDENPSSLRRSIGAAREAARSIREVVSLEVWEQLNELHLWAGSERGQATWREDRHAFYRRVRQSGQALQGILSGTMLEDDALRFIALGTFLERANQTARILDVQHHAYSALALHEEVETSLWLALLRACSGFEPFMKRFQGRVSPAAVARFLVLEPGFPRSVRFALREACARLAALRPPDEPHLPGGEALEALRGLADEVEGQLGGLDRASLHALLTRVVDGTAAICDTIGRELLGTTPPPGDVIAGQ